MIPFEVPRADLVASLAAEGRGAGLPARAARPAPARAGSCARCGAALAPRARLPIVLDLFGAASSPDRFVTAALAALPAGPLADRCSRGHAPARCSPRADAAAGPRPSTALFELPGLAGRRRRPPGGPAAGRGHRDPLPRLLPGPARRARALRRGAARARRRGHDPRHLLPDPGPQALARASRRRRASPHRGRARPPRCAFARAMPTRSPPHRRLAALRPRAVARASRPGEPAEAAWTAEMATGRPPRAGVPRRPSRRCCCAAAATACRRRCSAPWRARKG